MNKQHIKQLYNEAEKAVTGSDIKCPGCGAIIVKTTYQKKFCGTVCKDKYWNKVKPNPASHYRKYNVGEKSHEAFKERVENNSYSTFSQSEASGWPMGVDEGPESWGSDYFDKNE